MGSRQTAVSNESSGLFKLADIYDRYRSESDVRPLLDEILAPINKGDVDVHSTMTVTQFVETKWMPYCQEELAPAT
jgi:hypothetical protein